MYHPIICGALLAALAGKAVARNQLELQEKPYVRFMLSKPVASDRPEAIYIDLKDCATAPPAVGVIGNVQWHKNNVGNAASRCQTFFLRRLPWQASRIFAIGLSSFRIQGQSLTLGFGQATTNGVANLTADKADPAWQAGDGDSTHLGKSCLIRMSKPGQDSVCLTAPGAGSGESGPLNVAPCDNNADRWDIVKAGQPFTQQDHSAGWPA
ncbi:hypothetical protein EMMF5_001794 [Cystobasidiomycetes sp. EMM_F5]